MEPMTIILLCVYLFFGVCMMEIVRKIKDQRNENISTLGYFMGIFTIPIMLVFIIIMGGLFFSPKTIKDGLDK